MTPDRTMAEQREKLADDWERYLPKGRDYILASLIDRTIAALRTPPPDQSLLPAHIATQIAQGSSAQQANLISSPDQSQGGEPVAWRYRLKGGSRWRVQEFSVARFDGDELEVEPLYTRTTIPPTVIKRKQQPFISDEPIPPTEGEGVALADNRELAEKAIRTFCQSLGVGVVQTSSDGVERIYYSGISLGALSIAVALALRSSPAIGGAREEDNRKLLEALDRMHWCKDCSHPGRCLREEANGVAAAYCTRWNKVSQPEDEDESETCVACSVAFEEGDDILNDAHGGFIHAACCGPERESYFGADGDPLKEGEPIPTPFKWTRSRSSRSTKQG